MTIAERRARARQWIDVIRGDVKQLLIADFIFWELQKIWIENPQLERLSSILPRLIVNNHIAAMAVGVRRQVKGKHSGVSMRGLLDDLLLFPEVVSREHYLSFFANAETWLRETNGDGYYDSIAGPGSATLPSALVQSHIDDLKTAAERLEHFVDRRIAHYDRAGLKLPVPTFGEVGEVLRVLDRLVIFYLMLLEGSAPDTLLPPVDPGWCDVLKVAWINDPTWDKDGHILDAT